MRIHFGLDVGAGKHDRTAIVATEHIKRARTEAHPTTEFESIVTWAHRFPPDTPLEVVTERVCDLIAQFEAERPVLFLDNTGIGAALTQLLQRAQREHRLKVRRGDLIPFVLTAGYQAGPASIPKQRLVNRIVAAYASGLLGFARDLPDMEEVVKEMVAFQPTVAADGRVSFSNNPGLSKFDDYVTALGLAILHPEYGGIARFRDPRGVLWASQAIAVATVGDLILRSGRTAHITRIGGTM